MLSSKSQAKYNHWLKDPKAQELPPGWSDEEPKAPLADVVVPAVAQPLPERGSYNAVSEVRGRMVRDD